MQIENPVNLVMPVGLVGEPANVVSPDGPTIVHPEPNGTIHRGKPEAIPPFVPRDTPDSGQII